MNANNNITINKLCNASIVTHYYTVLFRGLRITSIIFKLGTYTPNQSTRTCLYLYTLYIYMHKYTKH